MGLTAEYPNLNKALNDYCQKMNGTQFLENASYFYCLTNGLNGLIRQEFTFSKLKELEAKSRENSRKLSLEESLLLVTEYLEERLPQYKDRFLQNLKDGTINIIADREEDKNESPHAGKGQNRHLFASIPLEYTTEDPISIIHEFLHTINCVYGNSLLRRYVTETISIYFESDLCQFLKEKGFTEEELIVNDIYRLSDLASCTNGFLQIIPILDSFRLLGPINSDTYDNLVKLKIFPRYSKKEDFYEQVAEYEKKLADIEERAKKLHISERKPMTDPLTLFGYIIGSLISYYAIAEGTPEIHQKMINLNEIVNTDIFTSLRTHIASGKKVEAYSSQLSLTELANIDNLSTIVEYIGLDITDEEKLKNKLLPPLKKKFQQVKDYSNGQKSNTKEK